MPPDRPGRPSVTTVCGRGHDHLAYLRGGLLDASGLACVEIAEALLVVEDDPCGLTSEAALLCVRRCDVQLSGCRGVNISEVGGEAGSELQGEDARVYGGYEGNPYRLCLVAQRACLRPERAAYGFVLLLFPGVPGTGAQASQQHQRDEREADTDHPLLSLGLLPCSLGSRLRRRCGCFTLGPRGMVATTAADLLGELARRPVLCGAPTPPCWSASSRVAVPGGHVAHCEPPTRALGSYWPKLGWLCVSGASDRSMYANFQGRRDWLPAKVLPFLCDCDLRGLWVCVPPCWRRTG